MPPSHIDEAGRAELRAAYAEAAGRVEDARRAFDRARAIENAAAVIIANAIEDEEPREPRARSKVSCASSSRVSR